MKNVFHEKKFKTIRVISISPQVWVNIYIIA